MCYPRVKVSVRWECTKYLSQTILLPKLSCFLMNTGNDANISLSGFLRATFWFTFF